MHRNRILMADMCKKTGFIITWNNLYCIPKLNKINQYIIILLNIIHNGIHIILNYSNYTIKQLTYGSRRSVRDLKSDTSKGSNNRIYQIVHITDIVFLIVELAITRSKMGLET